MAGQRALYLASTALDRLRLAWLRARHRGGLCLGAGVAPAFGRAHVRLEPGGHIVIGDGCVTESQPGNRLWVQAGGRLELGPGCWLRTEYGPNHLTVFPDALMHVGARAFINSAMLHARREIRLGDDVLVGFGTRILDADLHDLDVNTPERIDPVRIGSRVWIGSDVTVLRGVHIGDDTVVAARSVVTRDLPARVLAAGTPARVLREIGPRG